MTERKVRLRPLVREDLPTYTRWMQDREVTRFVDEYLAWPPEMTEQWYEGMLEAQRNRRKLLFAIEDEAGKFIGMIGLDRLNWKNRHAELDVLIGEKDHWGRGYGTEAIAELLAFAFRELNLHRIWLTVLGYNGRAIRCYEKCGFRHEGKAREAIFQDGRYYGELYMGILAEEFIGGVGCTGV